MKKNTEEKVISILTNTPVTRDDDNKLIANIWIEELETDMQSATDFLIAFYLGHFTNPETIRRTRQRAQEVNPHLRGFKYKNRQRHQKRWVSDIDNIEPTELQESLF